MPDREHRLLLKVAAQPGKKALALGGGKHLRELQPLFDSVEPAPSRKGLRAARAPRWHSATISGVEGDAWDACHAFLSGGLGVAGAAAEFAEPDLEQRWLPPRAQQGLSAVGACAAPKPQDDHVYARYPEGSSFDDAQHSQLAQAREAVGHPAARVRVAHLDTGFDPEHRSLPRFLRTDLQRNFTGEGQLNDARDPPAGPLALTQGHGTGTLGILAGQRPEGGELGGAARLEVVPIRVADFVVLFRTSAIARALDYVHGLWANPNQRVEVVTMSMGGVASSAWADAINALYERGVFVVTAAGNNFGNLPTHFTVYPARFKRVVAACGVMADGRPFADLPKFKMAGCYGPSNKLGTSLAAYTPNIPWPHIGCPDIVDQDGNGTSSATPQIAAAAALWLQHHRAQLHYPEGWMRVEAVRQALFQSAEKVGGEGAKYFGQGLLRAQAALAIRPAARQRLVKQPEDRASFALFKLLTGLGIAGGPPSRAQMLELEALQLSQRSAEVEDLLEELDLSDPSMQGSRAAADVLAALADAPSASRALRSALRSRSGAPRQTQVTGSLSSTPSVVSSVAYAPAAPSKRLLRVFAFDPSLGMQLETLTTNEAVLAIPWEDLQPGPVGEYLEVVDVDPTSDCAYPPVDLNHKHVLGQNGLPPSDTSPQFHQQMVYAVAMRAIKVFERALGRKALWAERKATVQGVFGSRYVPRLRIYPHALREANAYYSPDRLALLFGYFNASKDDPGDNLPGGLVCTCLSHDIVVHETVHALLDGIHPRFKEPTDLDMLAFHEAFADIVALFAHFSMPEALRHEMRRARGDIAMSDLLGGLAHQFGQAIGQRGALRSYVARYDEASKRWVRREPKGTDYQDATEAHDRGAVLVGAVFDAFLRIYERDTEDLKRLATGGSGVLPESALPADLVERLCQEAAKIAQRVLDVCIRALDYCPPVDLSFGEYLRALVTADRDLVPEDRYDYRVAFIAAFRARGIYPPEVSNLSSEGLCWESPPLRLPDVEKAIAAALQQHSVVHTDRYQAYLAANEAGKRLAGKLRSANMSELRWLGLIHTGQQKEGITTIDGVSGVVSPVEVHSVRPLHRIGPEGQVLRDVVIELTQRFNPAGAEPFHRGGCTLVCDLDGHAIRYVIRKRVGHLGRRAAQQAYQEERALHMASAAYFELDGDGKEPFAARHREG